ncbi:MAG: hypothetical protein AAF721_03550 [Myxococcota bacterium]
MSDLRFELGAAVMCNMGSSGWQLGRIVALHYREDGWPVGKEAPYQVLLEADHVLIYVPEDDARYCREPTPEDSAIARRIDALAAPPAPPRGEEPEPAGEGPATHAQLSCNGGTPQPGSPGYRDGRCHGCDCCPRSWSCVELYSEHYRCAARNGMRVTRRVVDLGTVRVGDSMHHAADDGPPSEGGFMQCPTLARLPPGVRFSDDGALAGEVRFDPHRDAAYRVEFVAVSTADWDDPAVGIVRLEITFVVVGNEPPGSFDVDAFTRAQEQARTAAKRSVRDLVNTWLQWEQGELSNRDTCDQMGAELRRLRALLEQHPRLDAGRWWTQLGGFHMNVHKLLENTLFECELYLGHALTFGDAEVRRLAEQNLEGCYQKRLLEAARFMWIEGVQQMMRGEWQAAAQTLRLAAAKKDGWGWAVNNGDIWLSEAAARLVHGAQLAARNGAEDDDGKRWIAEVARLLKKGAARAHEGQVFGPEGHPWASDIEAALAAYRGLQGNGTDAVDWLEAFKLRTASWCAQVLGGAAPFPPKPSPRREDAAALVRRLPRHND